MSAILDFWEYSLTQKNQDCKDYLISRSFNPDDFEWGYFPKTNESISLLNNNISDFKNLSIAYQDFSTGEIVSRLFNRLIFPIKDLSGKVIAISGRPITEDYEKPKYYNSTYSKKYNLYYLDQAIEHIRKHNFVLVCEGYFATLRMHHTCGRKNVVATCGTLFTRQHLDLLSRYTQNIGFLRDNDEAGKAATKQTLEKFKNFTLRSTSPLNLFPVYLDEEKLDPDDYVLKHGSAKLLEIIRPQIIIPH